MRSAAGTVPETCIYCPHLDEFHSNCSHPLSQEIIRELVGDGGDCPVYAGIRAREMRDLQKHFLSEDAPE